MGGDEEEATETMRGRGRLVWQKEQAVLFSSPRLLSPTRSRPRQRERDSPPSRPQFSAPAMEHPDAAGSGPGERPTRRSVKRSLEYPCVSRFRQRRLLAYLRARRFDDAFESFRSQRRVGGLTLSDLRRRVALDTFVHFRIDHLQDLGRSGRWLDAIKYIARFAPSDRLLGQEGQLFVDFVHMHNVIDSIVAGKSHGGLVAGEYKRYLDKNPNAPPGDVKLARILLDKAADMLEDLIALVPEFKDLLRMPNCPTRPRDVLPIGFMEWIVSKHLILPASILRRR
ncbi:hypothetical protein HU200_064165 [Digitaria exilis]|uniref:Uncharacterized protein n=1 Tax=Digitaria exilis TaxID=1010633 RepID=A0A835ACA2_9POAL|nr:hypothetical protein HU200_064165 [Digitaria exilis]